MLSASRLSRADPLSRLETWNCICYLQIRIYFLYCCYCASFSIRLYSLASYLILNLCDGCYAPLRYDFDMVHFLVFFLYREWHIKVSSWILVSNVVFIWCPWICNLGYPPQGGETQFPGNTRFSWLCPAPSHCRLDRVWLWRDRPSASTSPGDRTRDLSDLSRAC